MSDGEIDRLVAIDAIRSRLTQYCTAVDRSNLADLKDVYWPDATDDHGFHSGPAMEFAEMNATRSPEVFHLLHHSVSNIMCRVDGDTADVESKLIAFHRIRDIQAYVERLLGPSYWAKFGGNANGHDHLVGGRYVDRFERRNGEWRIAVRRSVTDWEMAQPAGSIVTESMLASV